MILSTIFRSFFLSWITLFRYIIVLSLYCIQTPNNLSLKFVILIIQFQRSYLHLYILVYPNIRLSVFEIISHLSFTISFCDIIFTSYWNYPSSCLTSPLTSPLTRTCFFLSHLNFYTIVFGGLSLCFSFMFSIIVKIFIS